MEEMSYLPGHWPSETATEMVTWSSVLVACARRKYSLYNQKHNNYLDSFGEEGTPKKVVRKQDVILLCYTIVMHNIIQ